MRSRVASESARNDFRVVDIRFGSFGLAATGAVLSNGDVFTSRSFTRILTAVKPGGHFF